MARVEGNDAEEGEVRPARAELEGGRPGRRAVERRAGAGDGQRRQRRGREAGGEAGEEAVEAAAKRGEGGAAGEAGSCRRRLEREVDGAGGGALW